MALEFRFFGELLVAMAPFRRALIFDDSLFAILYLLEISSSPASHFLSSSSSLLLYYVVSACIEVGCWNTIVLKIRKKYKIFLLPLRGLY